MRACAGHFTTLRQRSIEYLKFRSTLPFLYHFEGSQKFPSKIEPLTENGRNNFNLRKPLS